MAEYEQRTSLGLLVQSDIDLQWPDAFSFDEDGYLYATTNRIQRAISNSYYFDDVNFRIIRMYVGTKSYQHSAGEALTTVTYPSTDAGSNKISGASHSNHIVCNIILIVVLISLLVGYRHRPFGSIKIFYFANSVLRRFGKLKKLCYRTW